MARFLTPSPAHSPQVWISGHSLVAKGPVGDLWGMHRKAKSVLRQKRLEEFAFPVRGQGCPHQDGCISASLFSSQLWGPRKPQQTHARVCAYSTGYRCSQGAASLSPTRSWLCMHRSGGQSHTPGAAPWCRIELPVCCHMGTGPRPSPSAQPCPSSMGSAPVPSASIQTPPGLLHPTRTVACAASTGCCRAGARLGNSLPLDKSPGVPTPKSSLALSSVASLPPANAAAWIVAVGIGSDRGGRRHGLRPPSTPIFQTQICIACPQHPTLSLALVRPGWKRLCRSRGVPMLWCWLGPAEPWQRVAGALHSSHGAGAAVGGTPGMGGPGGLPPGSSGEG